MSGSWEEFEEYLGRIKGLEKTAGEEKEKKNIWELEERVLVLQQQKVWQQYFFW